MGYAFDTELSKNSHFYKKLDADTLPVSYTYPNAPEFGRELLPDEIKAYAPYSYLKHGVLWADTLTMTLPETFSSDFKITVRFFQLFDFASERRTVYVNDKELEQWTFSAVDRQPYEKTIEIPSSYFSDTRRISIRFQGKAAILSNRLGIGLQSLRLEM
jgi:hypothetical protein